MNPALTYFCRKTSLLPYRAAPEVCRDLLLNTFFRTGKPRSLSAEAVELQEEARIQKVAYGREDITTYFWEGEKPPILLVHGWESRALRFSRLIRELRSEGHGIIALDGIAHGTSSGRFSWYGEHVDVLSHVIRTLKLEPAALIGHSMGGGAIARVAFELDLSAPLVLLAPVYSIRKIMNNVKTKSPLHPQIVDDTLAYLESRCRRKIDEIGLDFVAPKMQSPALFIHDPSDDMTLIEGSRKAVNAWEKAELLETSGLGHSSIVADPEVIERICSYVGQ